MRTQSSLPFVRTTLGLQTMFAAVMVLGVTVPPVIIGAFIVPRFIDDTATDDSFRLLGALIAAAIMLVGAPFVGGLIALAWTVDPSSPRGRRALTILAMSTAATVVAAFVVLVLLAAATTALPTFAAVAISLSSALLSAACIWLGTLARESNASQPPPTWDPGFLEPSNLRAITRRMSWTLIVALLVSLALLCLPLLLRGGGVGLSPASLFASLGVGFAAAAITGAVMTLPLSRRVREIFGGDASLERRVARTVSSGKPSLAVNEERIAAHYAALMSVYYPRNMGLIYLWMLGVLLISVASLVDDDSGLHPGNVAPVAILAVGIAITVSLARTRTQRLQRYKDEHIQEQPETL